MTALSTLVCCLPVGFAAAGATATLSLAIAPFQSWFIGASLVLLGVGVLQLRAARRTCAPRGSASVIILVASAAVVLLVVFFPQVLAGILADWLS